MDLIRLPQINQLCFQVILLAVTLSKLGLSCNDFTTQLTKGLTSVDNHLL